MFSGALCDMRGYDSEHTYPITDGWPRAGTNTDTFPDTNGHTLPDTDGHTLPDTNGHTLPDTNGHTLPDTNGHTLPDTNTDPHTNSSRIEHNDNTAYDFIHVLINDVDPADDFIIHLPANDVTAAHNIINDHDIAVRD